MKTSGVQGGVNRLFFCDCKQTVLTAVALAVITASLCLFTGQALGLTLTAAIIPLILVPTAIYLCKQKTLHTPTTPTTPLSPPQERNQPPSLLTGSGVELLVKSHTGQRAPNRRFSDEDLSGVNKVLIFESSQPHSSSMSNSANPCTLVATTERENSAQQPLEVLKPLPLPESDSSYVSPAPQRNSNKTPASAMWGPHVPKVICSLADPSHQNKIEREEHEKALNHYNDLAEIGQRLVFDPSDPVPFINTVPLIRDDKLDLVKKNLPENYATLCRIFDKIYFISNFGSMTVVECTSEKQQKYVQTISSICPDGFKPVAELLKHSSQPL